MAMIKIAGWVLLTPKKAGNANGLSPILPKAIK